MKYTTPTDEELIARFSPEVRANYEKNKLLRQKEQEELMKIVRQTSQSNDPIWKTGKIASPFEKDTRGVDPRLVNPIEFQKNQEEAKLRAEVDRADAELAETENLLAQSKRRWWSWK